ncbi:MAG: excinuclease ABC subunit UvrC [Chloroflexota bacterium]|nr:excinuclease ABC subunit UvrC [Chloroflexota bacterium]
MVNRFMVVSNLAEERPRLAEALKNLPDRPGVYLFKDARGRLLYVGKAESLRDRVRSYFQPSTHFDQAHQPKVRQVVALADTVEYILTDSPIQALIWENDLVRKEQPRYNTKLRDDKHYPYIRINVQDPWPMTQVSRRMEKDGARYFGPFPHATSVRQTLDTLSRLFPQILCTRTITGTDPRACLYYHIKRCPAPCIGAIDNAAYRAIVNGMIRFLDGKDRSVLQQLRREMEEAAENLEFERAADLRDRIAAAKKVVEQERVGYTTLIDQDIVGLARDGGHACLQVFFMRGGRLARRDPFLMQDADGETDRAVLTSFVTQFYSQASDVPDEILLPDELDNAENVAEWLRQVRGKKVALTIPRRGEKHRIVELATKNARETLEQQKAEWLADEAKTNEAVLQLQEALGLPRPPRRIECYDISNIQGTNSVASMVVFEDGKSKRSDYKRFKIKTVVGANDFASMQEVLRRRFRRALEANKVVDPNSADDAARAQGRPAPDSDGTGGNDTARNSRAAFPLPLSSGGQDGHHAHGALVEEDGAGLDGVQDRADGAAASGSAQSWAAIPDLVIVDGGKGQLSAAVEVMQELELTEIPIVGLAKQNEEIFLPCRSDPILLPRNSQALYLVQRVRDEAHRFAITFHRKIRGKSGLRSRLEDVPGVGPTRKKALLRTFGSLKAMRAASVDDLAAVPGMTKTAAVALKRAIGD